MKACLTLLLLLAAGVVSASTGTVATAEHATATGDYRLAAESYEQLIAQNGFSAPVLFNLGNAWLRLGKPGQAILQYERALILAPGNPLIESNLAVAQERAGITRAPVGPWLAAARYFSFDTYAWTTLAALWVLCAALVLLCVRGAARRLARALIVVAALTLCVSADAAAVCWSDLYRAVVVSPATLHLAPAESAVASGTLREGEVVWIERRYAGFVLVRSADGHLGWVSNEEAVAVRVSRR
jgi:hypothetical protein